MAACSQQVEPFRQHLGGSFVGGHPQHQQHDESLRKDCGLLLTMSQGLSLVGQHGRGSQPLALDPSTKHHQAGNYSSASPLPVDGGLSPLSGALAYFSAAGTPSFGSNVHNNQFLPYDYDMALNRRDSLEILPPPDHPFFSFAFSPTAAHLPLSSAYSQADAHATVLPLPEQPISSYNGNNMPAAAAMAATQPAVSGPGSSAPAAQLPPAPQSLGLQSVQAVVDAQPSQLQQPADQGTRGRFLIAAAWPRQVAPFQLVRVHNGSSPVSVALIKDFNMWAVKKGPFVSSIQGLEVHVALADINAAIQQRELTGVSGDGPLLPAVLQSKPAVCTAAMEGSAPTAAGMTRAPPLRASGTGPNKRSRKR